MHEIWSGDSGLYTTHITCNLNIYRLRLNYNGGSYPKALYYCMISAYIWNAVGVWKIKVWELYSKGLFLYVGLSTLPRIIAAARISCIIW
jgi:hypothetical protein